ncbi:two-component system response regulator NarL [Aquisalimonas asiatica]|uniref:Two component transcriptional regulator, LuxR family n=1 Tax=Aquisalimonas asiatica TaxID=406100 RepID=A0A1H8PV18_9GAMM|nr:two-component system response regulator NarL [Aquisalimonas asiatica]SEO45780.1 two component transcriptional regulator, LuxR family [Aquisalimonas asiatica]
MTTRVLIVDDHPLLRRGVSQLLELEADMACVGESSNGAEALDMAADLQPDLILLDLNMQGMTGVETLKALRENSIEACIVMLTVSDSEDDLTASLRAGANGYLLKDMEPEALIAQLRRAAAGEIVISEALTSSLARALTQGRRADSPGIDRLTAREREILRHLARGESNKTIARNLGITEGTTKVHVKNLLKKMEFRSRVEAAVWAVQNELK